MFPLKNPCPLPEELYNPNFSFKSIFFPAIEPTEPPEPTPCPFPKDMYGDYVGSSFSSPVLFDNIGDISILNWLFFSDYYIYY